LCEQRDEEGAGQRERRGRRRGRGRTRGITPRRERAGHQINMGDDIGEEKERRGSVWAPFELEAAFIAGRYTGQCKEMTKSEVENHCALTYSAGCQEIVKLGYWKPKRGGHRTLASSTSKRCGKKGAVWVKYKEVHIIW
jgi:hypothetical protein